MPSVCVWDDKNEEHRVRRVLDRIRPYGAQCCVPDEKGVTLGVLRLCDHKKFLGTRGKNNDIGVCSKPQRPGGRRCLDILRQHLTDDEIEDYERAIREDDHDTLVGKQKDVTMKLFVRMLREKGLDLETVHSEMESQASAFRVAMLDDYEEVEQTMMLPETPLATPIVPIRRRTAGTPEGRQSLMQNRLRSTLEGDAGVLRSRTRSGRQLG
jgi:hypothetical protein